MKKRLVHILVLSCKTATLLIEKAQRQKLGPLRRLQLSMHLRICDGCLRYQQQSRLIEQVLNDEHDVLSRLSGAHLSPKSKSLIQNAIELKLKKK